MKGHMIMELTDMQGNKQVIHEDNMLTNGPKYFLASGGAFNPTVLKDSNICNDALKTLYGGIMLFDETLEENAETLRVPGGVGMVGNGSVDTVSNSEVVEMGSYNSAESGYRDDGSYKMVYDFTTSQANGTIKSVCLCPRDFGYIGIGNASGQKKSASRSHYSIPGAYQEVFKVDGYSIVDRVVDISMADSTMTLIDYYNVHYNSSYEGEFFTNCGKLKLTTYLIPLSIFDIRCESILVGTREIDIPSDVITSMQSTGYNYVVQAVVTDAVYIMFKTSYFNVKYPMYVMKLDKNLSYLSTYIITPEWSGGYGYNRSAFDTVINNRLLVSMSRDSTQKIYSINIENPTDIIEPEIVTANVSDYTGGNFVGYCNNMAYYDTFTYDIKKNLILPTNGGKYGSSYYYYWNVYVRDNPILNLQYRTDIGVYFPVIQRSTDFLSTINNLSTPVIKTSATTMKITYILTFND